MSEIDNARVLMDRASLIFHANPSVNGMYEMQGARARHQYAKDRQEFRDYLIRHYGRTDIWSEDAANASPNPPRSKR